LTVELTGGGGVFSTTGMEGALTSDHTPTFTTYERVAAGTGHQDFEVDWGVSVSKKEKLTKPAIENIGHKGTGWDLP
jgi:hypothetical protein